MLGRRAVAVVLLGWALLPLEAQACSVCLGWAEGQRLNGGFYWSALLLTLLPFVVVAVIAAWLCRAASGQAVRGDVGHGLEPAVDAELPEDEANGGSRLEAAGQVRYIADGWLR